METGHYKTDLYNMDIPLGAIDKYLEACCRPRVCHIDPNIPKDAIDFVRDQLEDRLEDIAEKTSEYVG